MITSQLSRDEEGLVKAKDNVRSESKMLLKDKLCYCACMTMPVVGSVWRFMKNAGFRRFWARKGLLGRGWVEH